MQPDVPAPYEIEVHPLEKPAGSYGWMLRKNGKLYERSDRGHTTEDKAWASALKALEGYLSPKADRW